MMNYKSVIRELRSKGEFALARKLQVIAGKKGNWVFYAETEDGDVATFKKWPASTPEKRVKSEIRKISDKFDRQWPDYEEWLDDVSDWELEGEEGPKPKKPGNVGYAEKYSAMHYGVGACLRTPDGKEFALVDREWEEL